MKLSPVRLLYEAAPPPPASPLLLGEALPKHIKAQHHQRSAPGAIYLYGIEGCSYGGLGIIGVNNRPVAPNELFPEYLTDSLDRQMGTNNRVWVRGMFSGAQLLKIAGPVYAPIHANLVYGHFLLEMLPQILMIADLFAEGARQPLLLSRHAPGWVRDFIELALDKPDLIFFDPDRTVVQADRLLIPSRVEAGNSIHPAVAGLFEKMTRRLAGEPKQATERVYLSRRQVDRRWSWHWIKNEEAIERLFESRGFQIISPEALSIREQIELFARTSCLAGEYSSALHNAMFMPRGTSVICLNWINSYQSRISTLRNQSVAYLPDENGKFHDWSKQAEEGVSITFDQEAVAERLDLLLA